MLSREFLSMVIGNKFSPLISISKVLNVFKFKDMKIDPVMNFLSSTNLHFSSPKRYFQLSSSFRILYLEHADKFIVPFDNS